MKYIRLISSAPAQYYSEKSEGRSKGSSFPLVQECSCRGTGGNAPPNETF